MPPVSWELEENLVSWSECFANHSGCSKFGRLQVYTNKISQLRGLVVKSLKVHMKRVVDNRMLKYDEMRTVELQIKACLNSRPLTLLSNYPGDLKALTPGHFLITAVPEPSLHNLPENKLGILRRTTAK